MERWVGKVAVVTGASVGIGATIAKRLADEGIIVVALARRYEKLKSLADSSTGKIHPKECDLTDEQAVLSTFRWIENNLGGVDILVNNAGVSKLEPLIDGDSNEWKNMLMTNVQALSVCTKEALKTMRKRGDNGHIFHMNSIVGHRAPAYYEMPLGMYTATKYAITALTEALRVELQAVNSNIRITSISPGIVKTNIADYFIESTDGNCDGITQEMPMISPDDVADSIIYALTAKPIVQVHEIILQPIGQKFG